MGIVLLLLLQWPIDRLFLPGTTLRVEIESDRNSAGLWSCRMSGLDVIAASPAPSSMSIANYPKAR